MSNKFNDINIKKAHTLLFQYKKFDPYKIKIDEKSYKNIFLYFIGYVKIKNSKYVRINSVNPLFLM